jgi:hypothetical protein
MKIITVILLCIGLIGCSFSWENDFMLGRQAWAYVQLLPPYSDCKALITINGWVTPVHFIVTLDHCQNPLWDSGYKAPEGESQ